MFNEHLLKLLRKIFFFINAYLFLYFRGLYCQMLDILIR